MLVNTKPMTDRDPAELCVDWTHAGFEWKTGRAYSSENGGNAGIASSVAKRGRKYIVHNSDYISHWRCSLSSDIVFFSADANQPP